MRSCLTNEMAMSSIAAGAKLHTAYHIILILYECKITFWPQAAAQAASRFETLCSALITKLVLLMMNPVVTRPSLLTPSTDRLEVKEDTYTFI